MRKFVVFLIIFSLGISVYVALGLSLITPKYKHVIKQGIISVDSYDKWSYLKVDKVCDEDLSTQNFEKELARSKLSETNFLVYKNNNIFSCGGIEYFKNFFVQNSLKSALLLNIQDIHLINKELFEWINYWIFYTNLGFNVDTQIQVYKRMREIYPKSKVGFYVSGQDENLININEYYADILILDADEKFFLRPYIVWAKDQLPENFIFDGHLF